jgi:hypothetical protein
MDEQIKIKRMWEIAWDMWRHRMKIMDTVDSLSLLAQMTALDEQVQARFTRHQVTPYPSNAPLV